MSTRVVVPLADDYRETVLSSGEADLINGLILVGDYLYGCTGQSPAKLIKIKANDFTDKTVITFASDSEHNSARDLVYSELKNLIYVLFASNGPSGLLKVSAVHPDTLVITDVIADAEFLVGNIGGGISTIGNRLYVSAVNISGDTAAVAEYSLTSYARLASVLLTGFPVASCARAGSVTEIFATAKNDSAPYGVIKRLNGTLSITHTETSYATFTDFGKVSVHFAISANHAWVGNESDSTGIVRRFNRADLTYTDIPTGILARCVDCSFDGVRVWVLFDNGKAVSIHPSSLVQSVYALNSGQGYISELVSDGTYLYTSRYQTSTVISRYRIALGGATIWMYNLSAAAPDAFASVTLDPDGNPVAIGNFGGNQIHLAKYYSSSGISIWGRTFGTLGNAGGVAVDPATGNICIVGSYLGTANLGGSNMNGRIGTTTYSIFVAMYNSAGAHIWSKGFICPPQSGNFARSVTFDLDGNPVFAGDLSEASFGDGTQIGVTSGSAFAASLNKADGSFLWANVFGSSTVSRITSVAVDSAGNIYATGHFYISIDFGGGNILTTDNRQGAGFLCKLDSSRLHVWSKKFGQFPSNIDEPSRHGGTALAVGPSGLIMTGDFTGTINLGDVDMVSGNATNSSIFMAKFSSSGAWLWQLAPTGSVSATGLGYGAALDSDGNMLFCGRQVGSVDYGLGSIAGHCFFVKFSSAGTALWSRAISTNQPTLSLAADNSKDVFVAGRWYGTQVDFGDGQLRDSSAVDGFLLKLSG